MQTVAFLNTFLKTSVNRTQLLSFIQIQPTKKPHLSQRNDKAIKYLISLFQQTLCTIVLDCYLLLAQKKGEYCVFSHLHGQQLVC